MTNLPGIRGDVAEFTWGEHNMLALNGHFDSANPGAGRQFVEDAATYDEHYFKPERTLLGLEIAFKDANIAPDPRSILDLGSGSGNSVIALAQKWPRAKILATDISPAMVAILNRRIGERGLSDRVTAVVMDATRVEIEPDAFDFIAGSSMLHHLLDPFPVLDQLLAGLQTGGAALFFEPFQPGNFVLRQALQELSRRNATAPEPFSDDVIEFFRVLVLGMDIVSSDKRDHPILPNLDDKWLFTKSQFEAAAERAGARLKIRATYVRNGAFRTKVVDLLKSGRGIEAPLPAWADEILRDYDSNVSPALREDLLMEGSIVFVK